MQAAAYGAAADCSDASGECRLTTFTWCGRRGSWRSFSATILGNWSRWSRRDGAHDQTRRSFSVDGDDLASPPEPVVTAGWQLEPRTAVASSVVLTRSRLLFNVWNRWRTANVGRINVLPCLQRSVLHSTWRLYLTQTSVTKWSLFARFELNPGNSRDRREVDIVIGHLGSHDLFLVGLNRLAGEAKQRRCAAAKHRIESKEIIQHRTNAVRAACPHNRPPSLSWNLRVELSYSKTAFVNTENLTAMHGCSKLLAVSADYWREKYCYRKIKSTVAK